MPRPTTAEAPAVTTGSAADDAQAPDLASLESRIVNLEALVELLSAKLVRASFVASTALAHTRCIESGMGMRETPFAPRIQFPNVPITSRNNFRQMVMDGINNAQNPNEWESTL